MSDYQTRALHAINTLEQIIPKVKDHSYSKSDYIYVEDPVDNKEFRYIEVSYHEIKKHLSKMKQGFPTTTDEIVEAILTFTDIEDVSKNFKDEIYRAVENSFGFKYCLAKDYLSIVKKEIEKINKEAGEIILNPSIINIMLDGSQAHYESSRCW